MSVSTLKPIKAPSLEQSNYGKNIDDQFKNINDNFELLSNHDFVKGDRGDNANINNYPLVEGGILTNLGKAIIISVLDEFNIKHELNAKQFSTLQDVNDSLDNYPSCAPAASITIGDNKHYAFDCINENLSVRSICIRSAITGEDSNEVFINGLTITDCRFGLKGVNNDSYRDKTNITCSVYVSGKNSDGYQITVSKNQNSLYYNNTDKKFYWTINGEPTGLLAQGPAGIDGKNASLPIFKATTTANSTTANVSSVLDPLGQWVTPKISDYESGESCILFISNDNGQSSVYFSTINIEGNALKVKYSSDRELKGLFSKELFMSYLSDIRTSDDNGDYQHSISDGDSNTLLIKPNVKPGRYSQNLPKTTLEIGYDNLLIGRSKITKDGSLELTSSTSKLSFINWLSISSNDTNKNSNLIITDDSINLSALPTDNTQLTLNSLKGIVFADGSEPDNKYLSISNKNDGKVSSQSITGYNNDSIVLNGSFNYYPTNFGGGDSTKKYVLDHDGFDLSGHIKSSNNELKIYDSITFEKTAKFGEVIIPNTLSVKDSKITISALTEFQKDVNITGKLIANDFQWSDYTPSNKFITVQKTDFTIKGGEHWLKIADNNPRPSKYIRNAYCIEEILKDENKNPNIYVGFKGYNPGDILFYDIEIIFRTDSSTEFEVQMGTPNDINISYVDIKSASHSANEWQHIRFTGLAIVLKKSSEYESIVSFLNGARMDRKSNLSSNDITITVNGSKNPVFIK